MILLNRHGDDLGSLDRIMYMTQDAAACSNENKEIHDENNAGMQVDGHASLG